MILTVQVCLAMREQSVAVKGRLMCGPRPASDVKVKLWDEDDGPDPDDVLDEGVTDADGFFQLSGSEREMTNIDPVFKVYHDCDDGIKPGQRKVKFRIPTQYISPGGHAKRTFDIESDIAEDVCDVAAKGEPSAANELNSCQEPRTHTLRVPPLAPPPSPFKSKPDSACHLLDGLFPTGGIPTDASRTYGLARVFLELCETVQDAPSVLDALKSSKRHSEMEKPRDWSFSQSRHLQI
ncbi:unnamed protein product [Caenorhabditis auriculariae]|uniref:Transthyretin-like family protein n=1 Tax=Caenorhabditis auriculariae TaxID=2777116 RepID=A0A8S1HH50_9PELO|nr:unnamed protein product [Caenorhabditis auriculariae]